MKIKYLPIVTIFLVMFMFNGCLVEEPDDIYSFIETEEGNEDDGIYSVDFYGSPLNPSAGELVYFTNTSEGNLVNYYWEFGDGNVAYVENPSHAYNENGVYDVSLTGYYENGASFTETKYEYVVVGYSSNVSAGFYADKTSVEIGEMVTFTSTSTGPINEYYWDFGDGTSSNEYSSIQTHTYYTEGVYTVSLTVYDPSYSSDTETKYDYIVVGNGGGGSNTYCNSYGGTNYEWIESVTFGYFNNYSGNDGGYGDYTNMTIYLNEGSEYIEIEPGFSGSSYTEYINIWIDYNNDGDFTDSGELIAQGYGSSTVSGNISIDGGSATGITTRMRISMSDTQYREPCEIFEYGEVEDYTVVISAKKSHDIEGRKINPPARLKPKNGNYTIKSKQ
jgi:PKD repeat protein